MSCWGSCLLRQSWLRLLSLPLLDRKLPADPPFHMLFQRLPSPMAPSPCGHATTEEDARATLDYVLIGEVESPLADSMVEPTHVADLPATLRAEARPFCQEASCDTTWCSEALSGEAIGAGTAGSGPLAAGVGCPPRKRACIHCSALFNPGIYYTSCARYFRYLHVNCVRPHYESAHTDDPVPEHYGGIQSAQTNSNAVAVDDKAVVAGLSDHLAPKRPRPPCERCNRNAWDYMCAACGWRVCAEQCWDQCRALLGLHWPPRPSRALPWRSGLGGPRGWGQWRRGCALLLAGMLSAE